MSRPRPLVSIICATFNAGTLLQACVDSIRSQEAGISELLVIDGGSTDDTLEVIRRNVEHIAHWESAADGGIADAWNKGLPHVRGEWVLFFGADDRFAAPDVLARLRTTLEAARGRLAVYGRVLLEGGAWDGFVLGEPWHWKKFRLRMTMPHQGTFHATRLFRDYGHFDPSIRLAADYELLLRPGSTLDPVFVNEVVAVMGGNGVSIRSPQQTFREARNAQLRHGVAPRLLIHAFHVYASARAAVTTLVRRS